MITMMSFRFIAFIMLVLAISATAITLSTLSTATSTTHEPITHTVDVGKNGFTFAPDTTYALPGDVVEFRFYPLNHSVVQSIYGSPCIPVELTGHDRKGFHSGFQPIDTVSDDPPKFSITIQNTEPIFFYCGAPNSCIGNGMVGAINPNGNQTVTNQRLMAENSTIMLNPGDKFPSEETSTTSSTPTATATNISPSPVPSTTHKNGLSPGAIIGTVIGVFTASILITVLTLYLFYRRKRCGDSTTTRSIIKPYISRPSTSRPSTMYTGPSETVDTPYIQPIQLDDVISTLHRTPSEHRQAEASKRFISPVSRQPESVYDRRSGVSALTVPGVSHQINDYVTFDGSNQWK